MKLKKLIPEAALNESAGDIISTVAEKIMGLVADAQYRVRSGDGGTSYLLALAALDKIKQLAAGIPLKETEDNMKLKKLLPEAYTNQYLGDIIKSASKIKDLVDDAYRRNAHRQLSGVAVDPKEITKILMGALLSIRKLADGISLTATKNS